MLPDSLLALWLSELVPWVAHGLSKEGLQGVVLGPVSRHPRAASLLVVATSQQQDYMARKVAADLAGFIVDPTPPTMLAQLFNNERSLLSDAGHEAMLHLEAQSVVENIVFAATRWLRDRHDQSHATGVLNEIIDATIGGEYWNTAAYAIATLRWSNAPDSMQRLNSFAQWAALPPPEHPSNPSMQLERKWSADLLSESRVLRRLFASKTPTSGAIVRLISDMDRESMSVKWGPDTAELLDRLNSELRSAEAHLASPL